MMITSICRGGCLWQWDEARRQELQEKAVELKEFWKQNHALEEKLTETRAQLADAEQRAAVAEQRAAYLLEKGRG
jgi:predicted  nucleic acid-binding Zn-ribbon protein